MRTLRSVFILPRSTVALSSVAEPLSGIEDALVDPCLPLSEPVRTTTESRYPSDYLFVSNVRFMSMVSIIWVHTILFWGSATSASAVAYLQILLLQAMKFGTIGFFLISGYLCGEGLTRTSASSYFYRRIKVVLVPWLLWGGVWFFLAVVQYNQTVKGPKPLIGSVSWLVHHYITFVFVQSIYWFVPNFFVCLGLVLWLQGKIPDRVQGVVFLICSIGYAINIYAKLIPERHTGALLGFVLYLWLGLMTYKYRAVWERWIEAVPWSRLAVSALVAAIAAVGEMHILLRRGTVDEFNTLRLSNQVFSVLVVMMIVKCKRPLFPRALDVRMETFGLYLLHPILLEALMIVQDRMSVSLKAQIRANGAVLLVWSLSTFVGVYLLSLLLTKAIRRVPALRWTVGR